MSKTRVTLSDLSKDLSLSTCTVSKILNKSFDGFSYSSETIKRVEEAAARLGYQANAQARALRTKRSGLIGLILPSARLSIFGELTDQIELQLRRHNLQLIVGHTRGNAKDEQQLLTTFLSRGLDGLFWIPSKERLQLEDYKIPRNYPLVILDRPVSCDGTSQVLTDNRLSSRLLAERVHATGHRRILVLNSTRGDRSMKERQAGIVDIFGKGVSLCDVENTAEAGRKAVADILHKAFRFTALLALSEPLAIGALAAMKDCDIELPETLSFAAFDDFPLASHWSPRITAVRQDVAAIASHAVEVMMQSLKSKNRPKASLNKVPAILEWRDSVTPPAARSISHS